MKELSREEREELWKIIEDVFSDVRSLKYNITQNEFDERLYQLNLAKEQIRKLIEEKPKVTREFVEKWLEEKWCEDWCGPGYYKVLVSWLIELLIAVGVKVKI